MISNFKACTVERYQMRNHSSRLKQRHWKCWGSGENSPTLPTFRSHGWTSYKIIKLTQDWINRRKKKHNLICVHWRITIRCPVHKLRLKEVIKLGTFLKFLDKETINSWEIDKTKKVLITKESKPNLCVP